MQKPVQILSLLISAVLGVAGLIAGCDKQPEPKAASVVAAAPAPKPAAAAPTPPAPVVLHTVGEGETLWDIARAYGVPMKDIMTANNFRGADIRKLRKGSQIKVPGVTKLATVETSSDRAAARQELPTLTDGAYHFLHRGETLWTLARLYDVPLESLMERNHFNEDINGQLRVGQPIIIPGITAKQIKQSDDSASAPKRDGFTHEMIKGETVWDVAHAFQVSVAEIMAANGLTADEVTNIRDGQKIFLPGVEDDGRGHVQRKQSAREQRSEMIAHKLGLGTLQAAGLLLHGHVEPRWIKAAGDTKTLQGTLKWPVSNGIFVRGYGSGQGGYHKAMDIMGKIGWNVRAAADGIVGYSGDKVSGFGNMVMVVHPGGWVTLYGHNSVNFVVAGDKVQKGSILAEVGSTGRSMGPHVHFELIFDGKNCNPAPLMRPGVRHRNNKIEKMQQVVWRDPQKRPAVIACARRQKHPMGQSVESETLQFDTHSDSAATIDAPSDDTAAEPTTVTPTPIAP